MPINEAPLAQSSAKSGYQRLPFWLESAAGNNFAWLHLPYEGSSNSTGLVICSPLGYEYTHAHRSVRRLADQLAVHRYPTLRFDLHGMGDSPGDLFAEDLLNRWIAEISSAIDALRSQSGVSKICLLGIRMGATLAAKVAEHTPVKHLVLWNPIVTGRRYVREMQALARMAEGFRQDHDDFIESAGFIMTAALAADIKQINLGKQSYKVNGKILVVHRDDLTTENDLATQLRQQGLTVDEITAPGFAAMMAEPQQTEVPIKAIESIVEWLEHNKRQASSNGGGGFVAEFKNAVTLLQNDVALSEKICLLGRNQQIFGILSQPAHALASHLPLIVMLNSGSVHHVGPNRLYVELCRSLSAVGFACLRIDLKNLGDSVTGLPANENHCYPEHANADVRAVIDSAVEDMKFKRVVLAGICSGAHTAFHAGLNNAAVCESIMINPLTFYWEEGMSLEIPRAHATIKDAKYYEGAMKDKRKWLKLLKGQVEFGYILGFVAKRAKEQTLKKGRQLRALAGFEKPARLCLDLVEYKTARRHLSFFFASSDPGYDILMSESPRTAKQHINRGDIDLSFIDGADHTFSEKSKRDELIDNLRAHLQRRYAKSSSNTDDSG